MLSPIIKSTNSHTFKGILLLLTLILFFNFSDFSAQICNDPLACNFSDEATPEDVNCDFCSCVSGTSFTTSHPEYGIEIEAIVVHSEGVLSGMTTYRLYFTTEFSDDEITSFTGLDEYPLSFTADSSFYQEPIFGGPTPSNASTAAISFIPNLAYDSWVTIGLDGPAVSPEANVSLLPGSWASTFENGESFTIDDGLGSGWYILPGTPNGVAGTLNRILFSQLTTDGDFSGTFRVQVFPQGNSTTDERVDIAFAYVGGTSDNICGCMSSLACNYNPLANYDDASCEYSDSFYDCDGVCIGDNDICGVCNGPGAIYECGCADIPQGDCNCDGEQLDECGVCNGPGDIYECGCADIPQGDCNCNGEQLDVLGECGGSCTEDIDADGVCDDIDDCVGAYDSCGVCNGQGAIYECGCADIPQGDCNCEGGQSDVVGVCGGVCTEDVNENGICDIDEFGCTDSSNPNFNPYAAFDDGSCFIGGCISEYACNYNPEAEYQIFGACDFTSCLGCIDSEACNYNSTASIDDGSCNYANQNYNCDGLCINDIDFDGVCDENEIEGCTDLSNPGYNPYATDDDGSCLTGGCTLPFACNYNPSAGYLDITLCDFNSCLGCMDPNACNYDSEATISSPASCTFPPVPFLNCDGICNNDSDGDGICDEQEIDGCTDMQAVNFNPNATDDNGSCIIQVGGCVIPFACNFDPSADYYLPGSCDFSCLGGEID